MKLDLDQKFTVENRFTGTRDVFGGPVTLRTLLLNHQVTDIRKARGNPFHYAVAGADDGYVKGRSSVYADGKRGNRMQLRLHPA